MTSKSQKKRKQSIPIEDNDVFGLFQIIVPNYVPYFVSEEIRQKITVNLIQWLMGNNVNYDPKDIHKAIDFLFERDHEAFLLLLSGKIKVGNFGPIFFPMVFFSSTPDVLDPYDFQRRRIQAQHNSNRTLTWAFSKLANKLKWTSINGNPVPKDHFASGALQGDMAERKVFQALQAYFYQARDACLVLHSHTILFNRFFSEKDFIILNLTKGYIMVIEVKASANGFATAKKQLRESKERVQAVFDSVKNMSNDWHYVGLCYIDAGDCHSKHEYVINGIENLNIQSIESKVAHNRNHIWLPNLHIAEFVSVAKVLLFEAQGHSQAPLTKEKQIEKIGQELDLASAPENIFFWTPEQLSIVQAMHIDWMCLMAYYGCGKTILLMERAEYLLRNPSNVVYFYIDTKASGLTEVLKLRFADKNIKIKTQRRIFDSDFDFSSDGVNQTDHLIIDEAVMDNSAKFLKKLKKFQSQVSTLWLALGNFGPNVQFKVSDFEDINFSCPTLNHCLRNGQRIVKLAQEDQNDQGLNSLRNKVEVKSNSNVNDGLLYELPLIYPNEIKTLREAMKYQKHKRNFIFVKNGNLEMSTLKNALPDNNFVSFKDEEALKNWLESSNTNESNQHLVLTDSYSYNTEVSGMEFPSMIYLSSICLKCGYEDIGSSIITRAKASLVIARYEKQNCHPCKYASYPNLKWNQDCKKWEIEQGITKEQLPEESREIFEKTSKLIYKRDSD